MRNLRLILILVASLAPLATASAASAELPQTGQTTCFDVVGTVVACAGTGHDGATQAGVAWPNPRFSVGVGATADCVTDRLTGLMWARAPGSIPVTWADALTGANDLTLCGFSDWRLPNVNELESLVNSEIRPGVFLNTQGFSGIQADLYWSSSSHVGSTADAWVVSMHDGNVSANNKSDSFYAWSVRAGK